MGTASDATGAAANLSLGRTFLASGDTALASACRPAPLGPVKTVNVFPIPVFILLADNLLCGGAYASKRHVADEG